MVIAPFVRPNKILMVWVCLALLLNVASRGAASDEVPSRTGLIVNFLHPSDNLENSFWKKYVESMRAAADDLGMSLNIYPFESRFALKEALDEATSNSPDYLVSIYYRATGESMLQILEDYGLETLIVNTEILVGPGEAPGVPLRPYQHWIGHMAPDDTEAGRLLAHYICNEALLKGLQASDGKLHVVAINGSRDTAPALQRYRGLKTVLDEAGGAIVLDRMVFTDWQPDRAYVKTRYLLDHYPEAGVIWVASDLMAKEVMRAAKEAGRKPGQDILIGSIDGSPWSLQALKQGELSAVVGGHFIEGAFSMILLYDHAHGLPLGHPEQAIRTPMHVFTHENLSEFEALLSPKGMNAVDYKVFSRVHGADQDYSKAMSSFLGHLKALNKGSKE